MSTEQRIRHELVEPRPEGFRFLFHDFDDIERVMYEVVTDAPEDKQPYEGEMRSLPMRRVIEQREVSEWNEVVPDPPYPPEKGEPTAGGGPCS